MHWTFFLLPWKHDLGNVNGQCSEAGLIKYFLVQITFSHLLVVPISRVRCSLTQDLHGQGANTLYFTVTFIGSNIGRRGVRRWVRLADGEPAEGWRISGP